jgi:hypothetical protein
MVTGVTSRVLKTHLNTAARYDVTSCTNCYHALATDFGSTHLPAGSNVTVFRDVVAPTDVLAKFTAPARVIAIFILVILGN